MQARRAGVLVTAAAAGVLLVGRTRRWPTSTVNPPSAPQGRVPI